jgi:hypothetical protein
MLSEKYKFRLDKYKSLFQSLFFFFSNSKFHLGLKIYFLQNKGLNKNGTTENI